MISRLPSRKWLVPLAVSAALVWLSSCSDDDAEPTFTTVDVTELSTICVESPEGETAIEAGDARVRVQFHTCLSSTCDRLLDATCSAEVSEGAVVVSGLAQVESRFDPDNGCSADCGLVTATCEVTLAEGSYDVSGEGAETFTLTVPGDAPECATF